MKGQRVKITTENELDFRATWLKEAEQQTVGTLLNFTKGLATLFNHTENSKVYAVAACSIAAGIAINKASQFGISNDQAGQVMWEFITGWTNTPNLCGLKMIDFSAMLWPASEKDFNREISRENFEALQELAAEKIKGVDVSMKEFYKQLDAYDAEMEQFKKDHPDYEQNIAHYTKNVTGTFEDIAKDEKRARGGFKFAPTMPKEPFIDASVVNHWQSIVAGTVPFGYVVIEPVPTPKMEVVKD